MLTGLRSLSPERQQTIRQANFHHLGLYPIHMNPVTWRDLTFDDDNEPIPVNFKMVAEELAVLRMASTRQPQNEEASKRLRQLQKLIPELV